MDGVIRTRVGYCGGTTINPNYKNIGDHAETLEFDYDGNKITYEEIINGFWDSHTPENRTGNPQYRSIIFYRTEEEKIIAEKSKRDFENSLNIKFNTEIVPLNKFYLAENYHQKFYLQRASILMKELSFKYSNFKDFIDSPLTCKLNGYCRGYGTIEMLKNNIDEFSLNEMSKRALIDIVEGYGI
ncbi:MAG: peptide-methionine (S)-S-oxide reductase [Clostridium argentinense]|nr:peptide-methionine (S)-S-oxide reductase [Clostridium argentinense]